MSGFFGKLLSAVFCASALYAAAEPPPSFNGGERFFGISRRPLMLITSPAKTNFVISSLQYHGQVVLNYFDFICQSADGKAEREQSLASGTARETVREIKNGKLVWRVESSRRYLDLARTIELGDYPGLKVTYEFTVKETFRPKRIFISFGMPQNKYRTTGYMKNGVMQFRPAEKSEWFGIPRSGKFPYITFEGGEKYGVMILAGDRNSWDSLPGTLLYSTMNQAYSSTEFMYFQGKELTKGTRGRLSFFLIPVTAGSAGVESAEIYAKLQKLIR